ncbi:hypothetical protein LGQ02_08725 [Bacillus shivajii]|uniref:ComEC/Rec2 family competence protein n=1 Tax=Bacillus shivajii TaxID=1983719 RepID=UPI001CF9FBC2|nr:hypothetical protein [Bacillus shivajii]UCZ54811.1 hypothetical protein LGQ02_08725 [Bacillus shivajii]
MARQIFFSIMIFMLLFLVAMPTVNADRIELNLSQGEIAYTFFDLEHGEATLIQNNDGKTVLINTGHQDSQDDLMDRLDFYDVDQIDTLLLTSKQPEYTGNVSWMLSQYPVGKIVVSSPIVNDILSIKNVDSDIVSYVDEGDTFDLLTGLTLQVLFIEEDIGIDQGSLSFFLTHKQKKLLYLTEANQRVEDQLVEDYDLKTTVMKVPDFGSEKGTSEKLLKEADPQVAVIFRNGEDLPSNYVLERLNETWIDIYQTSRSGTVTIKCLEDDYEIITVRPTEKETLIGKLLTKLS